VLAGLAARADALADAADPTSAFLDFIRELTAEAKQNVALTVPDLHAILSGVISMERNLSTEHRGIGLEIVVAGLTAGST
jgi:ABC-type transporter Mla subunit MlaD